MKLPLLYGTYQNKYKGSPDGPDEPGITDFL